MLRTYEVSLPDARVIDRLEQPNRTYRILRLGEQALADASEECPVPCPNCTPATALHFEQPELPFE